MTAATNTTLGTVKLAGDLMPGTGNYPTLVPSGVNPKLYTGVGKVHIDSKGRIVWAGNNNETDVEIPHASDTVNGGVKIGKNIDLDAVTTSISLGINTSDKKGLAKIGDGLKINVSTGATDLDIEPATTLKLGFIMSGIGLKMVSDILSIDYTDLNLPPATDTTLGLLKVEALGVGNPYMLPDETINYYYDTDMQTYFGYPVVGNGFNVDGSGLLTANIASASNLGTVITTDEYFYYDPGSGTINLHGWTSAASFGQVQGAGAGISIDNNGLITCSGNYGAIPDATTGILGNVQIGTNINVSSGTISIPDATTGVKGTVQVGTNINVSAGTISIPDATAGVQGVVQIGNGLNVSAGIVNLDTIPDASAVTRGIAKVGANINVTNGTLSVNTGHIDSIGLVSTSTSNYSGTFFTPGVPSPIININAGVLSYPVATASAYGTVQLGNMLSLTGTPGDQYHTRLVYTDYPIATVSNIGSVSINPITLSVYSGLITMNDASVSKKGICRPDNITTKVEDGTLSIKNFGNFIFTDTRDNNIKNINFDGRVKTLTASNIKNFIFKGQPRFKQYLHLPINSDKQFYYLHKDTIITNRNYDITGTDEAIYLYPNAQQSTPLVQYGAIYFDYSGFFNPVNGDVVNAINKRKTCYLIIESGATETGKISWGQGNNYTVYSPASSGFGNYIYFAPDDITTTSQINYENDYPAIFNPNSFDIIQIDVWGTKSYTTSDWQDSGSYSHLTDFKSGQGPTNPTNNTQYGTIAKITYLGNYPSF